MSGLPRTLHTMSFLCPSVLRSCKSHYMPWLLRNEAFMLCQHRNQWSLVEPTSFGLILTISPSNTISENTRETRWVQTVLFVKHYQNISHRFLFHDLNIRFPPRCGFGSNRTWERAQRMEEHIVHTFYDSWYKPRKKRCPQHQKERKHHGDQVSLKRNKSAL